MINNDMQRLASINKDKQVRTTGYKKKGHFSMALANILIPAKTGF
jgi:hypothetical protein